MQEEQTATLVRSKKARRVNNERTSRLYQDRVYCALAQSKKGLTAMEICNATGLAESTTRVVLADLIDRDLIHTTRSVQRAAVWTLKSVDVVRDYFEIDEDAKKVANYLRSCGEGSNRFFLVIRQNTRLNNERLTAALKTLVAIDVVDHKLLYVPESGERVRVYFWTGRRY